MRTSALLFASTLAVAASFARSAQAQECESDDECEPGQLCVYPPCAMPCEPGDDGCEPMECSGVCVEDSEPFDRECESNDECEDGWECQVVGSSGCAGVACPDGEECPEPEPCEEEEFRACVPPPPDPCSSDADCEDGLVCVTYEYSSCAGEDMPTCAPGEECPAPEPVECESVSESYCVPPYFAPCEVDEDCGTGFACVEGEMCGCSGGGGMVDPGAPGEGGGEGGEGGDREEPECYCEPTGELYCELQEMPCTADEECPEGFGCELLPAPSVPCSYDEETGETFCDDPTSGEESGQCVPETWMGYYGGAPAGSAEDYDNAVGGSLGGEAEASGRTDSLPPVTPAPGDESGGNSGESGGCQVADGGTGFGLLGILALVLVGARRRWL